MDSDLATSSSSPDQSSASRDSLARSIQIKLASDGPKKTVAFYRALPDDQISEVLICAAFHVVRLCLILVGIPNSIQSHFSSNSASHRFHPLD